MGTIEIGWGAENKGKNEKKAIPECTALFC